MDGLDAKGIYSILVVSEVMAFAVEREFASEFSFSNLSSFARSFIMSLVEPYPEDMPYLDEAEAHFRPSAESWPLVYGNTLALVGTAGLGGASVEDLVLPSPTLMLAAVAEQLEVVKRRPLVCGLLTVAVNRVAYVTGGLDALLEASFWSLMFLLAARILSHHPKKKEKLGVRLASLVTILFGYAFTVVGAGLLYRSAAAAYPAFAPTALALRNWVLCFLCGLILLNAFRAASWSFGFIKSIMRAVSALALQFSEWLSPDRPDALDAGPGSGRDVEIEPVDGKAGGSEITVVEGKPLPPVRTATAIDDKSGLPPDTPK